MTALAGLLCGGCARQAATPSASIPPEAPLARPSTAPAATVQEFDDAQRERIASVQSLVERASEKRELDPDLINGVIWVESRFQPRAKSPAGARGLMQLMPATAAAMARKMDTRGRIYDPEFNVSAGTLYLARLKKRFDGDETLALAAYNAGAGNVDKWIAGPGLPDHSIEYVRAVLDAQARFRALRQDQSAPRDTMLAAAKPEEPASAPAAEPEPAPSPARAAKPKKPDPRPTPATEPKPAPEPTLEPDSAHDREPVYEPPLADTPYDPDVENGADRAAPRVPTLPPPTPQPDTSPEPAPDHEPTPGPGPDTSPEPAPDHEPTPGPGPRSPVLPSVLD
jgi:hypothetical protein